MPMLKPGTKIPSDKEEVEITHQALEDGTLLTDEELAEMRPATAFKALDEVIRSRGRPKAGTVKVPVSIRLSPEVVDAFKATGKGWQTRIDEVLKEWVRAHS